MIENLDALLITLAIMVGFIVLCAIVAWAIVAWAIDWLLN